MKVLCPPLELISGILPEVGLTYLHIVHSGFAFSTLKIPIYCDTESRTQEYKGLQEIIQFQIPLCVFSKEG